MDVTNSMPEKALINSLSVGIGLYVFTPIRNIELSHEFITLPLEKDNQTLLLSLTFKHITKVEFLDNSEGEGAGLVIFVNDFMARKIQSYIDQGGNGFTDFILESYAINTNDNRFIVLDIQNKDAKLFYQIREILNEANAYRRNYTIQQINKRKKKNVHIPLTFIDVISLSQWKTMNKLLENARADLKQQQLKTPTEISTIDNNNKNGIGSPRISSLLTLSGSSNVPAECQNLVQVGQIHQHQPKFQLPAYTVMAVPSLPQPTTVLTLRVTQPSPTFTIKSDSTYQSSTPFFVTNACAETTSSALFSVPTRRLQSSAAPTVVFSQPSSMSALSMPQMPNLLIQETPPDLLFQLEHEQSQLYVDQQQQHSLHKTNSTTSADAIIESPVTHKFMPRSLKLPKAQPNNCSVQSNRSAPSFLNIQTPFPCTSQDHQLKPSPQSHNRNVPKDVNEGSAKVGKREREVHLIDDEENELEAISKPSDKRSNDTLFSFPLTGRDSCSVHYADLKYLSRNFMLNDTIIDFYLKYIHHCIVPQERRAKIFIFNSFFFGRLIQPPLGGKPSNAVTLATKIRRVTSNFQKVKNWTKKVNLFDMDYIIVPINEDIHWYLAIIVNVRHGICSFNSTESIFSSSSHGLPVPHLIVLNSLIDPAEDKHLAVRDQLGEYLHLEYADKHCQDDKTFFNKQTMDVVVPTMLPQQKNFIDCGLFLLHFAQLFLSNPPKFISTRSSFRRWYPNFEIKHKRDELRSVIKQLANHVKASDFVQLPTPRRKNKNVGRRSQGDKMQMILDGMALMGRTRRYSDSELDGIIKDEHFSCLYKPRSLDSLIYENREKPVVLQPPTIAEMSRFKHLRRVRQEIFAASSLCHEIRCTD